MSCDIGDILLKQITSLHSNASARTLINENFEKLQRVIHCVNELSLNDLNDLILPDPPELNVQYVLTWDGDNFVFVSSSSNPGTKYVIRPDEVIRVLEDHQYIVSDQLFLFGTLILEGNSELVIF